MYPDTSAAFIWMSSSQPSNVHEPNFSSQRWMSKGNQRTSTLHVLINIPSRSSRSRKDGCQLKGVKKNRIKTDCRVFGLPTWRQVLAETAGVHQHVGLEGGVKLVMSAVGETQWWK